MNSEGHVTSLGSVVYDHPTRFAQALQEVSDRVGPHLFRIPYNRFAEPQDQKTWWLSPDSDNPAYQWGKIVVTNLDVRPNLFVGLYIEKGVGKTASAAYSDRSKGERMILRDSWIWHDFFEALKDGAIEKEVRQIAQRVGSPVLVALDAETAEPTINWYEERSRNKFPRDYIRFSCGDEWIVEAKAQVPELLQPFNNAASLKEVAERIQNLAQLDWTWIDFQLGYSFATEPRAGLPAYDTEAVAAAAAPWKDWLRLTR